MLSGSRREGLHDRRRQHRPQRDLGSHPQPRRRARPGNRALQGRAVSLVVVDRGRGGQELGRAGDRLTRATHWSTGGRRRCGTRASTIRNSSGAPISPSPRPCSSSDEPPKRQRSFHRLRSGKSFRTWFTTCRRACGSRSPSDRARRLPSSLGEPSATLRCSERVVPSPSPSRACSPAGPWRKHRRSSHSAKEVEVELGEAGLEIADGRILLAAGNPSEARSHLERAVALFEETGFRLWAWRAASLAGERLPRTATTTRRRTSRRSSTRRTEPVRFASGTTRDAAAGAGLDVPALDDEPDQAPAEPSLPGR